MGSRKMEAKVDPSFLPPNAARFFWVSNEVLSNGPKFSSQADLDRLLPLFQDGLGL